MAKFYSRCFCVGTAWGRESLKTDFMSEGIRTVTSPPAAPDLPPGCMDGRSRFFMSEKDQQLVLEQGLYRFVY